MRFYKTIIIALRSVIILLIALFMLFFFSIYKDYNTKTVVAEESEKTVITSEVVGEIKPVTIREDVEEIEMVEINPSIVPTQNISNEERNFNSDKFYYNQLNKYSKLIYESLENQKENLKTGIDIIKIPDDISVVLEAEENNIEAVFSVAINAFEYDNPDVFYIDNSKLVLYYERDRLGNYNIYITKGGEFENYLIDDFNNKQEIEEAEQTIKSILGQLKNEVEPLDREHKILYIHDWLVDNIKYDETLVKTNRSNIYGALVEREVTCGGYAKAFKYIIDELNLNCIIVQGEATSEIGTEYHAWNYIQLDNKWYGVDCTWDDPIIIGEPNNGIRQKVYTYYLKGQNVFNNSHKPFKTFYSTNVEIKYPELEESNFN